MPKRTAALVLTLVLALALTCAGCDEPPGRLGGSLGGGEKVFFAAPGAEYAALDAQLGLLAEKLTGAERTAVEEIWDKLEPLRQSRLDRGRYEKSDYEWRLLKRLNKLFEEYTIKYLGGDDEGWGYTNPAERAIAEFLIGPDGALTARGGLDLSHGDWTEEDLHQLWADMKALLPPGAFDHFSRFTVFTDGEGETMAYVYALDAKGTRWEIAVDPADADDGDIFIETVLHEYGHYLTLNDSQVTYTTRQTVDTYNEDGMVSRPGSYIDQFYQKFWSEYLDDRLVNMDSYNFFLRHDYDFIDPYASTDPSEDICESFTFFVLRGMPRGDEIWQQKLKFFYDYPELVDFRQQVRDNLGLAQGVDADGVDEAA